MTKFIILLILLTTSVHAVWREVKTPTYTFNERYEIELRDQYPYIRDFKKGDWERLKLPKKFRDKKFLSIDADNRYIMMVTSDGLVIKTKHGRKYHKLMKWDGVWGAPFGKGSKIHLAPTTVYWAIQDWDMFKDKYIRNPINNEMYRTLSIAHLFQVHQGGSRITVHDPWLVAEDYSYEICLPDHGNSSAVNFKSSGAFVFMIDTQGRLLTRLWNLDIAGYNNVYARYKYEVPKRNDRYAIHLVQFLRKILLPGPSWEIQPKIPGIYTSAITVMARGKGSEKADLFVEGSKNGKRVIWYKDINDKNWKYAFVPGKLKAAVVLPGNKKSPRIMGKNYFHKSDDIQMRLIDFKDQCSPTKLQLTKGKEKIELKLHLRGIYRLKIEPPPLKRRGAIEFPPSNKLTSNQKKILTDLFGYRGDQFLEFEAGLSDAGLELNEGLKNNIFLKAE